MSLVSKLILLTRMNVLVEDGMYYKLQCPQTLHCFLYLRHLLKEGEMKSYS
jgi:hypothetical protein